MLRTQMFLLLINLRESFSLTAPTLIWFLGSVFQGASQNLTTVPAGTESLVIAEIFCCATLRSSYSTATSLRALSDLPCIVRSNLSDGIPSVRGAPRLIRLIL